MADCVLTPRLTSSAVVTADPVILAGEPLESLLIKTVRYDGEIQMPPKGKLSESDIAELTKWVKQGAWFPPSPDQVPRGNGKIDFAERRKFWSFQRLQKVTISERRRHKLAAQSHRLLWALNNRKVEMKPFG